MTGASRSRHPVWFEREVLPDLARDVAARATILGPGAEDDPLAGVEDAHGAVVGVARIDAAALDRSPGLKVVARTGIGVDNVDVAEATRRGIAVCNAPDGPTASTAEHTIALILAVAKNLRQAGERLRAGQRDLYARHTGTELEGATLGLVGYGRIARRVAGVGRALGMSVVFFDPHLASRPDDGERVTSLAALLAAADVVSLHVPLTDSTAEMFGADQFSGMRDGAVFVNTARGGLVDHAALLSALESGRLLGAGLDVTDPEPLPPDHPLLGRDDVVVTPHIATATGACRRRLFRSAFEQVIQALDGQRPDHLVDPAAWPTGGHRDPPHRAGTEERC